MTGDLALSNSLTDLAARIRAEHEATAAALTSSVDHAMTAGDLLIEAKAQLKHGQWLPWLTEHCAMSERTAQLYMRIAKNRATIENNIRNGVADLTLGQAAALMMMTADMKKVLDFVKQVETTDDPEQIVNLCIEHGFRVIKTPGYDMFANCTEEEKREWHVFLLFLVKYRAPRWMGVWRSTSNGCCSSSLRTWPNGWARRQQIPMVVAPN
jgi:hypothetical protein